jgi:hypothetical protein
VIDYAVKYVDGQVHTKGLENFWSLLKHGISGIYVSYVSAEPLTCTLSPPGDCLIV